MNKNYELANVCQISDKVKKSGPVAEFVLLLISLAALITCAMAQENISDYSSNKADYWYNKGLILAGTGSYDEAYRAYDKAIQINSDNAGAWYGEALTLRALSFSRHDLHEYNESLKAFDMAIEKYDRAIKADPQDANNWYYKGLALSDRAITMQSSEMLNISNDEQNRIRYFEDAIKAYDNATEINSKFATAWKNKGNVFYILGKYNESIQAYDKAIEIVPDYPLAWYDKGLALNKTGKYDEAVQAYNKAIEKIPKNADMWYNKGNALSSQGKYDEAINSYDKAIQLNQVFAEAWHNKGVAFEKSGFGYEANATFDKAKHMSKEIQLVDFL
ncbi:Photosystem I assembly protein Ycf3 [uncultured archaeon]|nr:Photosystem I assembly protein Ycf3 [uncultured archaeon]